MAKNTIIYNGVKMTEDWPGKIESSQKQPHYTVAGRIYPRVRFGDEDPRWGDRPCRDCGVLKGQFHVIGCEYERCPVCAESFAGGCTCDIDELKEGAA
jgi:hypothetical protein